MTQGTNTLDDHRVLQITRTIRAALLRRGGDSALVEELSQEVWRKVLQRLAKPGLREVVAYARRVADTQFCTWLRGRKRFTVAGTNIDSYESSIPEPGEGLETQEQSAQVRSAVESLAPDLGTVIRMFYFERLHESQIAKQLGLPVQTIKNRMRRARELLKNRLERLGVC